jgi:hypothetical protein
VRFVVALITLAVAIPRLPVFDAVVGTLGLFDAVAYSYALLPLGVALAITSYRWRLSPAGRFVAVIAFVAWVTLTFAAVSVTSIIINAIMATIMFSEILAHHDC